MKKGKFAFIVIVVAVVTGLASAGSMSVNLNSGSVRCVGDCTGPVRPPIVNLHDAMREMWMDHNVWSRNVLMAVFGEMKGCEFYEDRVRTNLKELHALLLPYYGNGADKFVALLDRHLEIEDQILYAMKTDDQTFRSLVKDWYGNGEDIADLLFQLNPKVWNRDVLNQMWRMQLDASLEQGFAYKKGDWASEIDAFDLIQDQSMKMADYLSAGIPQE